MTTRYFWRSPPFRAPPAAADEVERFQYFRPEWTCRITDITTTQVLECARFGFELYIEGLLYHWSIYSTDVHIEEFTSQSVAASDHDKLLMIMRAMEQRRDIVVASVASSTVVLDAPGFQSYSFDLELAVMTVQGYPDDFADVTT